MTTCPYCHEPAASCRCNVPTSTLAHQPAATDPVFRCADAPTANGRKPQFGESQWDMWFRLEDGRTLHLLMGQESHDRFRGFLLHEELDDAADAAASATSSDEPAGTADR